MRGPAVLLPSNLLRAWEIAAKVFSTMSVFDGVRVQLSSITWTLAQVIKARISLDRIDEFLHDADVLDRYKNTDQFKAPRHPDIDEIGFRDAAFAWTLDGQDGTATPSSAPFRLQINGDLFFNKGKMNLIVGPTYVES